ncbi:MAG: hypothetical protein ACI9S8_002158 [Chlamydiales bacterium]|jgi:hypothetical protein
MTRALKLIDVYRLTAQLSGDMLSLEPGGRCWGHVFSNSKKNVELTVIHGDLILEKIKHVYQDKVFNISSDPESFQIEVSRMPHNPFKTDQITLTRTQGNEIVPWKKFTVTKGKIDYTEAPIIDKSDGCTTFTFRKVKKIPGFFSGISKAFKRVFRL